MSTLHLKATLENGRFVAPCPPELAATATEGTTFDIAVNLPGPEEEDVPLPTPDDGPEAYLRSFETLGFLGSLGSLGSLGDIVLPPNHDLLALPRRAFGPRSSSATS